MPSIFKRFSKAVAEPYVFPDAAELKTEEPEPKPQETPEGAEPEQSGEEEYTVTPQEPLDYAKLQADAILADARREADELLERTREELQRERETVCQAAEQEGYQAGYQQGMAQVLQENAVVREKQAAELGLEVQRFLERANSALERQLDENVGELRDLALAVAEKVVCISLKSSSEVIGRMIQTAIDKRKRREWVHIYVAECDAKRMAQVSPALTASLAALSDRVRIIPMAGEEPGTCVIEMPDAIVDASASTQMHNIRNLLTDPSSGEKGNTLF